MLSVEIIADVTDIGALLCGLQTLKLRQPPL